jgi:hypothetical protein
LVVLSVYAAKARINGAQESKERLVGLSLGLGLDSMEEPLDGDIRCLGNGPDMSVRIRAVSLDLLDSPGAETDSAAQLLLGHSSGTSPCLGDPSADLGPHAHGLSVRQSWVHGLPSSRVLS